MWLRRTSSWQLWFGRCLWQVCRTEEARVLLLGVFLTVPLPTHPSLHPSAKHLVWAHWEEREKQYSFILQGAHSLLEKRGMSLDHYNKLWLCWAQWIMEILRCRIWFRYRTGEPIFRRNWCLSKSVRMIRSYLAKGCIWKIATGLIGHFLDRDTGGRWAEDLKVTPTFLA